MRHIDEPIDPDIGRGAQLCETNSGKQDKLLGVYGISPREHPEEEP